MITFTPIPPGRTASSVSSFTSNESPGSSTTDPAPPNSTLFVGDLSLFTNEVDLYNHFVAFGELVEIKIMRCEETLKNLSYGFVKFVEHEAAANAMKAMHGKILNGRPLRIKWASHKDRKSVVSSAELPLIKPKTPSDANYMNSSSIHINFITDQLSSFVTEDILRDIFSRYGEVIDITLKKIEIDELRMIQKGYAFIHFPANAKGVASCLQCCMELKDTIVDGVKYRCDISHKLMKELSESDDPDVMKMVERSPALLKTIHRANPIRKTKTRGAVLTALSQETTAIQYPYLAAYMTNMNPYSQNYATGYAIAATTTTTATVAAATESVNNSGIFNFKSSSSESTSTDSMEGFINQVAFIDTREAMMAACPSVDFENGQVYSQFGQGGWNVQNATPIRRTSFSGWASEFIPLVAPPPVSTRQSFHAQSYQKSPPLPQRNSPEFYPSGHNKDKIEGTDEDRKEIAEDGMKDGLRIDTGSGLDVPPQPPQPSQQQHSHQQPSYNYALASPTWFHPVNSVLYPYYSYTQFPSPAFIAPSPVGQHHLYSPKSRKKSFTTIQQNHRQEQHDANVGNLPPGLQQQKNDFNSNSIPSK